PVAFAEDCIGERAAAAVNAMKSRATSCAWRTPGSTRARSATIPVSSRRWPRSATSSSTTPSRWRTAPPLAKVLKAYSISELDVFNAEAQKAYVAGARKAIEGAHGRSLRTLGRVEHVEGAAAPKTVAIVEWDSLDDAVAFYKSKAWTDMQPQRDKAYKVIRRYAVEVEK